MNHTTDGQEQRKKTTDKIEGNNYCQQPNVRKRKEKEIRFIIIVSLR